MCAVVFAIVASMALGLSQGIALGLAAAVVIAVVRSHGTLPDRARQVLGAGYLKALAAFAVVALVWDQFDDWKAVAIVWLIAAFVMGVWLTSGPVAARDRWALVVGSAAAVAGLAMAWLNVNWVSTPAAAWFVAVALVSASVVGAALRWPDLRWFEKPAQTKHRCRRSTYHPRDVHPDHRSNHDLTASLEHRRAPISWASVARRSSSWWTRVFCRVSARATAARSRSTTSSGTSVAARPSSWPRWRRSPSTPSRTTCRRARPKAWPGGRSGTPAPCVARPTFAATAAPSRSATR